MQRILLFIALALLANAQVDRGRISGYLRDASGAVLPNAPVRVINENTGVTATTNSNEAGYYQMPNLLPGSYTVSVEAPGFRKSEHVNIRLSAGSEMAIDMLMQVGGATESVTVVASAAAVQSDTAQLGRVVEAKQLDELSLSGENPLDLIYTKPGVIGSVVDGFDWAVTTMRAYVNGMRRDEDIVTVDGAIATRTRGHQAVLGVMGADMVQEVQIFTSGSNAEYGRGGGGQFRFVTKSGTRQFHGNMWEFLQNSAFNANTWARNRSGVASQAAAPAPYTFNQFGFTIGGPVYIPGKFNSDRNKLFFFVGEEFGRLRQTMISSATVPSVAERRGDFSELLTSNPVYGSSRIIKDPLTGAAFPGNIIPTSRLSTNGLAMLNAYPLPLAGYQSGSNNWTSSNGQPANQHKDTFRVDYNITSTEALVFRGSLWHWDQWDAFSDATNHVRRHSHNLGDTSVVSLLSTLSPTLVNEFSISANKDSYTNDLATDTPMGGLRSKFGITYPLIYPNNKQIPDKIPTIEISNFTTIDGTSSPLHSAGPIYQISDNITKTLGNHTIKAGFLFDRSGENDLDQISGSATAGGTNNQNGDFQFRDSTTGGAGLALANAALGRFDSYAEYGQKNYTLFRSNSFDLFVQDGWKVNPKLRLEFGVRYNYWPGFYAEWNNFAEFRPSFYDASKAAVVNPVTGLITSGNRYNGVVLPGCGWPNGAKGRLDAAGDPQFDSLFHCLDRSLANTPKNVFEPRFGLAYSLNSKTAIRAAAGVFHYRMLIDDSNHTGANPPVQALTQVVAGSADNPAGAGAVLNPLPQSLNDPNRKIPTSFNWNFTVQRELPKSIALEVAYVGTRAYHLLRQMNINSLQAGTLQANPGVAAAALRPYLGLGTIIESAFAAGSHHNSLQVALERRFRAGLGFSVAYTWSKTIDSASDRSSLLFNAYNDKGYIGPADFDRTHVLVMNSIYELPLLKHNTSLMGRIFGKWEITTLGQFQTGLPLWVTSGTDQAGVSTGNGNQPWNAIGDPSVSDPQFSNSNSDSNYYFNPKAFALPAAGTFGNAGRNSLRGVGSINWDAGLRKDFAFSDTKRFQFRWELYNLMNHPNWSDPNTTPTSGSFGRVQSKTGNRSMQFGLKYFF